MLDTLVSAQAHRGTIIQLRADEDVRHVEWRGPAVRIEQTDGALVVSNGVAQFRIGCISGALLVSVTRGALELIREGSGRLMMRGCSGREYVARSEHIRVEESGPIRATVVIDGYFDAGGVRSPFAFRARMIFVAGKPTLRLEIQVHNPKAATHPGGLWDLSDHGTVLFEDLTMSLAPAYPVGRVQWYGERSEDARTDVVDGWALYQDSSGGENWDSENHIDGEGGSTVTFRGYRVTCRDSHGQMLVAEGDRATPYIGVVGERCAIGVTTHRFWQNFPKALRWSDGLLSVGLFPGECAAPFALQGGEQKRHAVLLEFLLREEASFIPASQTPLKVCIDPQASEASGAIDSFTASESNPDYQKYVNSIIDGSSSFESRRELIDEYGWRHFGDLYADHEAVNHRGARPLVSHYNNQYDFIHGALVQFLRSCDTRWWTLAEDAAWHTIDIDLYHTDSDKAAFNHGLFWHTDHYKPAATCTHRTYSRANGKSRLYGGGPSNEHNYTTGLLLYFYLSGDQEAAAAVRALADWVMAMDDGSLSVLASIDPSPTGLASKTGDSSYHHAGRGAGNSINALLDAYSLTGVRSYLQKAEELVRRCIHPSDDIDSLRLSDPELRWSYLVFLQALGKYLYLKCAGEEFDYMFHYARSSLLHYARWMALHEVPYMEVLDRVVLPTETWPAQDMRKCHVLHLAAAFAPPVERDEWHARATHFFKRSLADVLSFGTAYLTRPRVILCVCGYPHTYFEKNPEGPGEFGDPQYTFGEPESFVPQRMRWRKALPARIHVLVGLLARITLDRVALIARRSSPLRS
jgi:hypothetical protein